MNGINLLKCICDETRFEILELLQKYNELSVNEFVKKIKKDQPLVSHHLKILKTCGIVKSRDEGKKVMYSISSKQLSEVISSVTKASKEIPHLCSDKSCC